jgi:hypothetical protein
MSKPGSTYSMERELPTGRVENRLEVFAREHPATFGIRTTSGPTPLLVSLPIHVRRLRHGRPPRRHRQAARLAATLGPLAARAVKRGVDANFATLTRTLEARAA